MRDRSGNGMSACFAPEQFRLDLSIGLNASLECEEMVYDTNDAEDPFCHLPGQSLDFDLSKPYLLKPWQLVLARFNPNYPDPVPDSSFATSSSYSPTAFSTSSVERASSETTKRIHDTLKREFHNRRELRRTEMTRNHHLLFGLQDRNSDNKFSNIECCRLDYSLDFDRLDELTGAQLALVPWHVDYVKKSRANPDLLEEVDMLFRSK